MATTHTDQELFRLPWYRQVKFKAMLAVATLFLVLMIATAELTKLSATRLFEDRAHTQLSNAAQSLQGEIAKRTDKAEILVKLIADMSVKIASDAEAIHALIPELIETYDAEQVIAGGGVWPEPRKFDPNKTRESFFWGRDEQGVLRFYDDYNDPQGAGYHNEEWYVPGRHLKPNRLYWSKSYTDPYSQQAMVTVTAPMYANEEFLGVATLDLKLEGLKQILNKATESFGGYAFAVDKHGRFLSFPDISMVSEKSGTVESGSIAPFKTLRALADKNPSFKGFEELLSPNESGRHIVTFDQDVVDLSIALERASYQISPSQAIIIAQELLQTEEAGVSAYHFRSEADYFFGEPSRNLYLNFNHKGWHIVSAMPESYVLAFVDKQISNLYWTIGLFSFTALLLTALFLDKQISKPLQRLVRQLRNLSYENGTQKELVKVDDNSEFGLLAEHFNQRTLELISSQKEIQKLAFYDPLTSLPNRRLLTDYLNSQLASSGSAKHVAVMFIDIDNFKTLNDSLGHAIGDQLLVQMADRLRAACDNMAFIARLGGDEFVVVTSHSNDGDAIHNVPADIAEKIALIVDKPFVLNGNEYHITVSMGIALDKGAGVDELLKHADSAMYNVKEEGRNGWCFFETAMQVRADERLQIESELREAIKNNQLDLVYQPQIDLHGDCIGLEALSRWHHEELGYIPPPKFISIAEESMLIHKLGHWLLEAACKQIVQWEAQGFKLDHVAINISPRQIQDSQFVGMVIDTIRSTGVAPQKLMLEITEGVLIHFPESVIDKMKQLKALGIRWSIDDFGTGYSSLTYLKRLPLDELKIDKSFVNDLPHSASDEAIVETIISIAQKFGFKTIAEGVESEEQRSVLIDKGCFQFQGYLFSKPISGQEIEDYLALANDDNQNRRAV